MGDSGSGDGLTFGGPGATLRGMSASPSSYRAAVTGVRTFLGRRLLADLEADPRCRHIVALDVRAPEQAGPKTRFRRLDLTDPASDERCADMLREDGVDTLAHCAFLAYPSHSRSWAHELEAIGSLYVMNAVAEARIRKFILCSTTAVYGAHPSNPAFLTERSALRGVKGSRWVADRVTVEKELDRLRRDFPDLVATSLRFGMTVGPTIRNFYTKLLRPQLVPTVMGYDPLVQFLHEDDATAALFRAVSEDHPGVFNIVGAGTLYYSDVLRQGGKIAVPVPHFLGYPAATALFNLELSVVPGPFLDLFRYSWVADDHAMRERFGFTPRHSSREAIVSFFDSLADPRRAAHPAH